MTEADDTPDRDGCPSGRPAEPGGAPLPREGRPGGGEGAERFLAHHYKTPQQQFEAGKLGMWIFLVTEVLFFGGLFCAYAVYRAHHPEVFAYAAGEFLDKTLGAINTGILILSSFTMAWAVRCAQLGGRWSLVSLLGVTFVCAAGFLGIKYVEYKHKWEAGLLGAREYQPKEHVEPDRPAPGRNGGLPASRDAAGSGESASGTGGEAPSASSSQVIMAAGAGAPRQAKGFRTPPRHVGIFFSIYFAMTGLHALHVIGGMVAIAWLVVRAARGHFGSHYFGPADYVGLYWHLVDLIWIYLFPLLYLIHGTVTGGS